MNLGMQVEAPKTTGAGGAPRVVRHPAPLSFRALCEEVLPRQTRYLVLDLDRTVHLDINTGEMLGWELNAWHVYGPDRVEALEPRRGQKRMYLDWELPKDAVRYFARGVRQWALPGLYYLLWGKLAAQIEWLHRLAVKRHGPHFMQHAQRTTQMTLMRIIDMADPTLVAALAERVWQRHRGRQAITAEDIAWVKARCPDVEIILTSASPRPTVEVAARHLGIETYVYSTLDRINSGIDKVKWLREMRPDIGTDGALTVGITDTQYGEDHSWADYFHIVVDINSRWPFPDSVRPDSPLREVHSAQVLIQDELQKRAAGARDYCDPRREELGSRPLRTVLA